MRKILKYLCLLIGLGAIATPAYAEKVLKDKEKNKTVEQATAKWSDWNSVSISGKFKMAGLPLSPSLKIFMQKDRSIFISLRAPLMGEVGRAEISRDTILVVNKMKKTYVKEPMESLLRYYPGGVSDLQTLLMARPVVPGYGELSPMVADMVQMMESDASQYLVMADEKAAQENYDYAYVLNSSLRPVALLVVPRSNPDINVALEYQYDAKGYDVEATYYSPKRSYSAVLELDNPVEGGSAIEPIRLNSKYTRLKPEQFLKSF